MTIEGNGKINLVLDVKGILPSGYHSVKLIMQEITLSDKISLDFGRSGVSLSCSSSEIPTDNKNIAFRAAELFYAETGISDGVHIHIDKHIPIEAGLGGGSTDGAAVLKAMNEHYGYPLSDDKLIELSTKLGADVPFFIPGGTAVCEGIGEIMTPVESKIKLDLLIVKPDKGMSTPLAYRKLDESGYAHVNVDKVVSALENGDTSALYQSMGNVFEPVAEELVPEVAEIKKAMLSQGAKAAMMSGSGTAVFGIFRDTDALNKAYEYFKPQYKQTFKAKTVKTDD